MSEEVRLREENETAIKAILSFRKADRVMRSLENRFLRQHHLTTMQFGVLEVLYHRGPMNVQKVIQAMYSTPGNMTVVIHNMERDGYLCRERSESDRRCYRIALTEKGSSLIERIFDDYLRQVSEIMCVLTKEEQETLLTLTNKLSTREGETAAGPCDAVQE